MMARQADAVTGFSGATLSAPKASARSVDRPRANVIATSTILCYHKNIKSSKSRGFCAVEKKRRRKPGRPKGTGTTGIGTLIGVRCHAEFLAAVDKWRGKQEVPPARAAAVRRLAEIGLEKLGLANFGRKAT
jgi:hypothetical protein